MALTKLGYLAVKRETTQSTAVVPTHFVRFNEGDMVLKRTVQKNDPIQNNRAAALYPVRGKDTVSGGYKFDLEANECVHWLAAALGSLTSTDVSSATDASVYSHSIKPANSLPYLSIEQGKGNLTDTTNNYRNFQVERSFGCVADSFTISGKDAGIEMDVKLKAMGQFKRGLLTQPATAGSSVKLYLDSVDGLVTTTDTLVIYDTTPQNENKAIASITAADPSVTIATLANSYAITKGAVVALMPQTPSYSIAPQYFSFGQVKAQLGATLTAAASAAAANLENWEVSFDNKSKEMYGTSVTTGHFGPNVLQPTAFEVKGKYTHYFTDVADRDAFLGLVQQALILTIDNGIVVSATDTGLKHYSVAIKLPNLIITTRDMPTGKDDLYAVKVDYEGYYDSSNAESINVIVQNAMVGTTYTA